jgi:hypothetical protein
LSEAKGMDINMKRRGMKNMKIWIKENWEDILNDPKKMEEIEEKWERKHILNVELKRA